jgi:hypothetical protein
LSTDARELASAGPQGPPASIAAAVLAATVPLREDGLLAAVRGAATSGLLVTHAVSARAYPEADRCYALAKSSAAAPGHISVTWMPA